MFPFSSRPNRASPLGFTLVELLIVVAIVSLLAAILFPVFGRAREKARQSNCTSNLKQIGLALKQYAQDYDGSYPTTKSSHSNDPLTPEDESLGALRGSGFRAANDPLSLPVVLVSYLKNTQIFVCPSGRKVLQELGNTYQYNGNKSLLTPDQEEADSAGFLLLWDNYSYKTVTPIGATVNPTPNLGKPERHCAHFNNFNQLFLDGHVKLYPHSIAGNICPVK